MLVFSIQPICCQNLGFRFLYVLHFETIHASYTVILQYQGSKRADLRELVKSSGKRFWMSEVGFGSHSPDDIWAAMDISRCILDDLNIMQVNGWVYWQVNFLSAFQFCLTSMT